MQESVPSSPDPIAQVTAGMLVVDANGDEVGTVVAVAFGDPNAVVAQEPPTGGGALSARVPHTEEGDEPEVPPDLAARLLRGGYVKVDGPGPPARDVYVEAGQIADVTQNVVELTVARARLAAET